MVDELKPNERHTGQEAILKFTTSAGSGGEEKTYKLPFTNVSWSRDVGTTDVQHNDDLKARKAITDIRFSGSFEYSGQNFEAINALMYGEAEENGNGRILHETSEPARGTLTVKEQDPESGNSYIYSFKGVVVTGQSRDVPADDSSSTSYDWEAEDLTIQEVSDGSTSSPGQPNEQ